MRKQRNESSVLLRRADVMSFMAEVFGILSFIPTGAAVMWVFGDLLTGAVWFSAGATLMVCAWICHRESDKALSAAVMRGKTISPAQIRHCMKSTSAVTAAAKRK